MFACYVSRVVCRISGVLSLARPLDFETTPQYIMTVEARDGGTPSLRNTAIVKVNVTDANDNTPQFAHATYTAELSEAAQIHDTFLQVRVSWGSAGGRGSHRPRQP